MRRHRWTPVLLAVVLAVAGCGPRTEPAAGPGPSSTGTASSPVATASTPSPAPTTPAAPVAAPGGSGSGAGSGSGSGTVAHAAPGSAFAVGIRQLSLNRGGSRPLRTVVWYPATGAAGGTAKSGATPAAGRFPVVLFSHGLTASPESYQNLTVRFAAAGFVVAAPAYPFTSAGAPTFDANDLINQPADASYVITAVLKLDGTSGDPLAGHLDPARVGAGGHSAGGYTTVGMLSGSGRDPRVKAGIVLSGGSLGSAFSGAATPLLFIHGDADEVVSYATGRSAYARSTWPKAFLTITGGNHSSPVFGSKQGTTASAVTMVDFLRWSLYGDTAAKARLGGDATVAGATTYESRL